MFPIKRIVIHHSGTKAKWWQIKEFWRKRNLKPYYHYLIDYDGKLIKGLQDFERGAHIANMNTGSIGICLLGNYTNSTPSDEMINALDCLISFMVNLYHNVEIVPHNKYNDTICPGEYLAGYSNEWNEAREEIKEFLE